MPDIQPQSGQPIPPRPLALSDRDRWSAMIGILTAMLLAALDQSIVTPAMPTIGGDLGNAPYLPWVVTAYLLTATAVAPLYGKLADVHGRRGTLYCALGLFLLGSLFAAIAQNMFVLIGARAVQGLGGGGLFVLAQIVIGDMAPPRERGRFTALISGMWAVAGIAGPLLGGTLAEYYWPLIFWINLPLGALAIVVINKPLKRLAKDPRPHRLDGLGAALMILATAALLLMLNWAGSTYPWFSAEIIGLAAISATLWIAFGVRLKSASEPLVSIEVLSNPIALTGCFAMFLVSATNIGLTVFLPIYAQSYLRLSPAESGYALLGFLLGTTAGSTLSGLLTLHIVRVKWICIIGAAVSALALWSTGLMAAHSSIFALEIPLTVGGVGLGMTFPVTTISVQNGVGQSNLGVITGMLTFLRSLGSALGVAVLGAIALGYDIPLSSSGGEIAPITASFPFVVLFDAMAAMMLGAALIYGAMPHKPLQGSATG